jgi:RNA polymerase sigma-70 factor (ECF subfamily)
MCGEKSDTFHLLQKYQAGDQAALNSLLKRYLPWIEDKVRKNLYTQLRNKARTEDYAQDVILKFIESGPRIKISDPDHFRALLYTIVERTLKDKHRWFSTHRRNFLREKPGLSESVLNLDPPKNLVETPSKVAQRHEESAWVVLGMDLLDPPDRDLLVLRKFEGLKYKEIGERLGISPEASRKRHDRAIAHLDKIIYDIRNGKIGDILAED